MEKTIKINISGIIFQIEEDAYEILKNYLHQISAKLKGMQGGNEMIEDIKGGNINLVIAYKIDRLTRSPKDFYQLIELFDQHGVDFLSVTERFDTSTPSGRLLRNIMLTFAQFERDIISERTKEGLKDKKNVGKRGPDKKRRKRSGYNLRWSK